MTNTTHTIFYGMQLLKGKCAAITGGGSGIGRQIAYSLAEQGSKVFIIDYNKEAAVSAVKHINHEFGRDTASAMICDVSSPAMLKKAIEKISEKYGGRIDIFISNAGINIPCRIEDLSLDQISALKKMVEINQLAAYYCAAYAYPSLLKGTDPSFIIMGSCASQGSEGQGGYSGTKAALRALMGTLVKEWAASDHQQAIRVNLIEPDYLEDTGLRTESYLNALARSRRTTADKVSNNAVATAKIPMRREGKLIEVAEAVIFLLLAGYANGNALVLSGGKTVRI
jgi:NAD(P)-dependent dehydrogenase (short-subunit alcohol dehydrogenase family)